MKSSSERMRGVVYGLASQGRINNNLLHFPDEILLCAKEYIKAVIVDIVDKGAEEVLTPLVVCGETNEDGHSEEG